MGAKTAFSARAKTFIASDLNMSRAKTMKSIVLDVEQDEVLSYSFESMSSVDSHASERDFPKFRKNIVAATTTSKVFASCDSSYSSQALASLDALAVSFVKYRYPKTRHFRERKWGELPATILCLRAMRAYADCNAREWRRHQGDIRGSTEVSQSPTNNASYREKPSKLRANPISEMGGITWHSRWKDEDSNSRIVTRYGSFKSPLLFWEPKAASRILRGLEDATFAVMAREEDLDDSRALGVASNVHILVALPFNGDGGYSYRKQHIAMKLLQENRNPSTRYCVVLPASPYYFYREGKTASGKAISEGAAHCVGAVSDYYVKGVTLASEAGALLTHLYFDGYKKLGIVGTSLGGYSCAMAASIAQVPLAIATCFVAVDGGIVVNGVLGKLVDWKGLHSTMDDCGEWFPSDTWNDDALPECTCLVRKGKKPSRKEWMRCVKDAWATVSELTSLKGIPKPVTADCAVVVGAKNDGFVGDGAAEVARLWKCTYWEVRGGHASGILFGDNGIAAATTSFRLMGM